MRSELARIRVWVSVIESVSHFRKITNKTLKWVVIKIYQNGAQVLTELDWASDASDYWSSANLTIKTTPGQHWSAVTLLCSRHWPVSLATRLVTLDNWPAWMARSEWVRSFSNHQVWWTNNYIHVQGKCELVDIVPFWVLLASLHTYVYLQISQKLRDGFCTEQHRLKKIFIYYFNACLSICSVWQDYNIGIYWLHACKMMPCWQQNNSITLTFPTF